MGAPGHFLHCASHSQQGVLGPPQAQPLVVKLPPPVGTPRDILIHLPGLLGQHDGCQENQYNKRPLVVGPSHLSLANIFYLLLLNSLLDIRKALDPIGA